MESGNVKGIVLAGSYHWGESSFQRLLPRPLLPVAQKPLICYALQWLADGGVGGVTVCVNRSSRSLQTRLAQASLPKVHVDYYEDSAPRGAAGCVRDAGIGSEASTFVVADGTAIPAVDIEDLLAVHRRSKAAVTVVGHREGGHFYGGERVLSPGGIYVFERRVLDQIPELGFQDIKENLIPRLNQSGERVLTYAADGVCPRVLNPLTYLAVNQWMVERLADMPEALDGYIPFGYSLAHPSVRVSRTARIIGPTLIGPSARILSGATIVGPTVIGEGCTVGEGAFVSRSVTWRRCLIGRKAVMDRCILADDAVVEAKGHVVNLLKVPGGRTGDSILSEVAGITHSLEPFPTIVYPRPALRLTE